MAEARRVLKRRSVAFLNLGDTTARTPRARRAVRRPSREQERRARNRPSAEVADSGYPGGRARHRTLRLRHRRGDASVSQFSLFVQNVRTSPAESLTANVGSAEPRPSRAANTTVGTLDRQTPGVQHPHCHRLRQRGPAGALPVPRNDGDQARSLRDRNSRSRAHALEGRREGPHVPHRSHHAVGPCGETPGWSLDQLTVPLNAYPYWSLMTAVNDAA